MATTLPTRAQRAQTDQQRRIDLALDATAEDRISRLVSLSEADPELITQILACELQRVHRLLSGGAVYDYEAQAWLEGGAA